MHAPVSALHIPCELHAPLPLALAPGHNKLHCGPHNPGLHPFSKWKHWTPIRWQPSPHTNWIVSVLLGVQSLHLPSQHVPRPLQTAPPVVGQRALQFCDMCVGTQSWHMPPV